MYSSRLAAIFVCAAFLAFDEPNALRGAAASSETGHGEHLRISAESGFYESAFDLRSEIARPNARIYFTTNGTLPKPGNATVYERPLRIETTTVLRAVAFEKDRQVGPVETRTFIFLRDVLKQTGEGFPKTWGFNEGKSVPADYEMDPEIVNDPAYREDLLAGLKAIPTLSLVTDPIDLFDPEHGVYANPKQSGSEWERAVSAELRLPGTHEGFRIDCGVRIQGGWNRRPEESPKHAFRLLFGKKHGAAKLKFLLFGSETPTEFDELILRAGCNNTWLHWSAEERRRGDYIRDQWMRDSYRAMGHPSARGRFIHLYLNGLYWGLYNVTERPGASFAAAHFGGKAKEYDARNGEHILEGDKVAWEKLLALANSGLRGEREYSAISELLDLPAFADFMILNFYGANADWDRASNWYAARRRMPADQFHFFIWDAERTLEAVDANSIATDDDQSPMRLFHKLRENARFRLLFADRVQRHLFGDGALTNERAAQRFRALAQELDQAIVGESARWGDYRRDVHQYKVGPYELYTRNDQWRPEIQRLLKEYFPARTGVVVEQFRQAGLYSRVGAPTVERNIK